MAAFFIISDTNSDRLFGFVFTITSSTSLSSLIVIVLFDLFAHPCGYVRRVCLLQQLFCFFIERNRASVRLLPTVQRNIVFRQDAVHISDRYACGCNNLCNWRFLTVKLDNEFFSICHLYFVLMPPTELAGVVIAFNHRHC